MERVYWDSDRAFVCERCGGSATIHVTIKDEGQPKRASHWCDAHAKNARDAMAGGNPAPPCRAVHPYDQSWICDRPLGHEGDHDDSRSEAPAIRVPRFGKAGVTKVYTQEQVSALERDSRAGQIEDMQSQLRSAQAQHAGPLEQERDEARAAHKRAREQLEVELAERAKARAEALFAHAALRERQKEQQVIAGHALYGDPHRETPSGPVCWCEGCVLYYSERSRRIRFLGRAAVVCGGIALFLSGWTLSWRWRALERRDGPPGVFELRPDRDPPAVETPAAILSR
jgi:hypothetical protein